MEDSRGGRRRSSSSAASRASRSARTTIREGRGASRRGARNDVASEIISREEEETARRQRQLRAVYEAQEEHKARREAHERFVEAARKRESEKRKNKNIDFLRRIFDVKHHMSVLISPLPPAVRYSLTRQFSLFTSAFTIFFDKDGVQNAKRAIYGSKAVAPAQRTRNDGKQRGDGTRIIKKQVVRRVKKSRAPSDDNADEYIASSAVNAAPEKSVVAHVSTSRSDSSSVSPPSALA